MNKKKAVSKHWIQSAHIKKGALHRQLGVKAGSKIPVSTLKRAAGKGGVEGRRARLAETLKGLNHKDMAMKKMDMKKKAAKKMPVKKGAAAMMCKKCGKKHAKTAMCNHSMAMKKKGKK